MTERETRCFYCTKYSLSNKGKIEAQDLEISADGRYAYSSPPYRVQYVIGRDCFEHQIDALIAVEKAIDKKVVSLKAQIVKLDKMKTKLNVGLSGIL